MPIRSVDKSGTAQAAVVLAPAARVGALYAYLRREGPRPDDVLVLDARRVSVFTGLSGRRQQLPRRLPSLGEWELGGDIQIKDEPEGGAKVNVPPRGEAFPGLVTPRPNEDLLFFDGPFPPPSTRPDFFAFRKCVSSPLAGATIVTAHSPIRLLARDSAGNPVGRDEQGANQYEVPDSTVLFGKSGEPYGLVLPSGGYELSVTGTGSGKASVVVVSGDGPAPTVGVFDFKARKGATGKLALTAAGAAPTLRFGGRAVRQSRGVGLRLKGVPRRLRPGNRALRLRVTDQFGDPVPGALVGARGKGARASGQANASGRLRLTLAGLRKGKLKVRADAGGYRTARATARVR